MYAITILFDDYGTMNNAQMNKLCQILEEKKQKIFIDPNVPESEAFERKGVIMKGNFDPERENKNSNIIIPTGKVTNFDGIGYIEFTNGTSLKIGRCNYLFVRAIREYRIEIDICTDDFCRYKVVGDYISDVLLFKCEDWNERREYEYVKRLVTSDAEREFIFEDPRIHEIYENDKRIVLISGTHYSGPRRGLIVNKYAILDTESFSELKEEDFKLLAPDKCCWVDSKNGIIYRNEKNEIVVRTRFYLDFGHQEAIELLGKVPEEKKWERGYSEQVFIFRTWKEFVAYDWNNSIFDLFGIDYDDKIVRPRISKVYLRVKDLKMTFGHPLLNKEMGKNGFGPGCIPLCVFRKDDELFISNSIYEHEEKILIGKLTEEEKENWWIKENEIKFVSFDHEIEKMKDYQIRYYTCSIKVFNSTGENLEAIYSHVIQPREGYERGCGSGIIDLQHIYPVGRILQKKRNEEEYVISVFSGVSDASCSVYDFDPMNLMREIFDQESSKKWKNKQVYFVE